MTKKTISSTFFLLIDCIMLLLIICNLSWIFFDSLFESQSVRDLVAWLSPAFFEAYTPIHNDFLRYDMFFVTIYVVEFGVRWAYSVYHRHLSQWYYYPFVHWYDLLGCIPIGAFHFLRVLRIIVILRKLQDLGIIELRETIFYRSYKKYSAIVTEEVSDRVVAQVLDGMSLELKQGTPVLHQIVSRAIIPRTEPLGDWLSSSLTQLVHHSYDSRKTQIRSEIQSLVKNAAKNNTDLKRLVKMPLLGDYAAEVLERTITDMIFDITDQIMDYFKSDLSTKVISESLDAMLKTLADPKSDANHLVQSILLDTIQVLKQQVQIQQWKTTYA